ncbi:jg15308 [Pararge aegeria aegeria]|uniref:Jg15308 protein n=1 Tax=Pararge aegeria aegeria TaxID=348720 RepID=A0A8S4R6U5_9NEOP|nr:jg15308 [Pararge aegeria aegeria]
MQPPFFCTAEDWKLKEVSSKKLETFEIWAYRRMLRCPKETKFKTRQYCSALRKLREFLHCNEKFVNYGVLSSATGWPRKDTKGQKGRGNRDYNPG